MDELFQKPHRQHVSEIPIAPILDMMVAVIFFLVLSTSFVEYTKQTLPPSGVSTITDPVAPPPLAAKLYMVRSPSGMRIVMTWAGERPNQIERMVAAGAERKVVVDTVSEIAGEFKNQYPNEKSIQVGLGPDLNYQDLISVMDGVQVHLPDVVLVSSAEAEAVTSASPSKNKGG